MEAGTLGTFARGLIFPIIMIGIFYFFLIRPQKKQQEEKEEMISNIVEGDRVITIGGIHGKVITAKEDVLTIESSSAKTKLDITRWAVGRVVED